MSVVKLEAKFSDLKTASIKNLIPIVILDCNGLLSGSQGLDVRFKYPDFYNVYREMATSVEKEASELLGQIVVGAKPENLSTATEATINKQSEDPIFGIFGFCTIVSKDTSEDKIISQNIREYNIEAIHTGICKINEIINSLEWGQKKVICFATDDRRLIDLVEYIYRGNEQFQVIICKD